MYYLVKSREKCDVSSYALEPGEELWIGDCECVIKADSKEAAEEIAKKDLTENEVIVSIEEISVEKCIEREMENILREIYRQYKVIKYDYEKMTVREYNQAFRHFDDSPDEKYEAVKLAAKNVRLFRLLRRIVDTDKMTIKAAYNAVNRLSAAETEEEFDKVLIEIKEENK